MSTRQTRYSFLKKCFRAIEALICIFLTCFLLSSCSADKIYDSTGKKIDNKVFASIRKDIEDMKDPAQAEDGDVFWTPNGTSWHLFYDCTFLSDSKTVLHGTLEQAKTAGKEKVCSRCSDEAGQESTPTRELQEGDVFWTASGGLWHTKQDCRYISNSSNVLYGSVDDAKNAGKSGVCSSCGKE